MRNLFSLFSNNTSARERRLIYQNQNAEPKGEDLPNMRAVPNKMQEDEIQRIDQDKRARRAKLQDQERVDRLAKDFPHAIETGESIDLNVPGEIRVDGIGATIGAGAPPEGQYYTISNDAIRIERHADSSIRVVGKAEGKATISYRGKTVDVKIVPRGWVQEPLVYTGTFYQDGEMRVGLSIKLPPEKVKNMEIGIFPHPNGIKQEWGAQYTLDKKGRGKPVIENDFVRLTRYGDGSIGLETLRVGKTTIIREDGQQFTLDITH